MRVSPPRDAWPWSRRWLALPVTALAVLLSGCTVNAAGFIQGVYAINDPELKEISGLAPAATGDFWGHNDHGNRARLFRLGREGQALGRLVVKGSSNLDWEAMARMPTPSGGCLLVGDIGDNLARRDSVHIEFIPEPEADAREARVAGHLVFRYPDGPRDAEGLAFDQRDRQIYVLSKRETPPALYRLPAPVDCSGMAAAEDADPVLAEYVGDVELPPPPMSTFFEGPRRALGFNLPTGLDITPDGQRMAVLSYGAVFVYDRATGERWEEALRRYPGRRVLPTMEQAESIILSSDGSLAVVASEGKQGQMVHIALPDIDTTRPRLPGDHPLP
ncbi:hypothetical protein KHP57_06790 [Algiphilus sp. NNCM1]|uniref:hypothetical protein n=1 Tax=Algiphilus sp. TaxID=1872431 RepID=UPI001CA6C137|nr:hypothetical protein [Algiphilus sp.]MBY8965407.1 hypothetical protein [Algiphilus acroporae]MCI5062778.1 hypothetical protein [Algiphilus sp.]MCI5103295.1 hypothetical protein [Algiphilus sp.]